jgi:adenylosuccinate lyase
MLTDMTKIVRGLVADEERIRANIELTGGLIYSQRVMLALIDELKLPRETVYAIVQDNAKRTAQSEDGGKGREKFLDLLAGDERLRGVLDEAKLASLFDLGFYTRYTDRIFERFGL